MDKRIPMIVGITGGIGSGKTTACKIFESLGIAIFYADHEAKRLYDCDGVLRAEMADTFGPEIFSGKALNREALAKLVFNSKEALHKLNQLVHPAVARRFDEWRAQQLNAPYLLKEAAILIESGGHEQCDKVVLVTAPEEVRIARVANRDGSDETEIRARMNNQKSDEEKRPFADYVIENDGETALIPQVMAIHQALIAQSA